MINKLIHCFPLPTDNEGISYISLSIYREMRKQGVPVSFITPVIRREAFGIGISQAIPPLFRFLPWKFLKYLSRHYYRRAVLAAAKPGVILDLWSDHEPELIREAKRRGAIIVKEKFNCAQRVSKKILANEYLRQSLPDRCKISENTIRSEEEQLALADYIFSPSPMVRNSLVQIGVEPRKILDVSFGWGDTGSSASEPPILGEYPKPIFLYVGTVEVRKGAHLLLEYWQRAGTKGTLVFLGGVREEMKMFVERSGNTRNVVFLGHREKAHHIYNEADVFVFPSLEEGGPLVTYEAMARGIPVIVSPMGAGAVARADVDGRIIEPHDSECWNRALKELSIDAALRQRLSVMARAQAAIFTWEKVAQQRFAVIKDKLL